MQESLAGMLHEVVGLLDRSAAALLREEKLSFRQYHVLSALAGMEPTTQHQLAGAIGHSDAAISRMVGTLSRAGLVSIAVDPEHRRRNEVRLTPAGRDAEREASALLGRALGDLMHQHRIDEAALLHDVATLRNALRAAGWSVQSQSQQPQHPEQTEQPEQPEREASA